MRGVRVESRETPGMWHLSRSLSEGPSSWSRYQSTRAPQGPADLEAVYMFRQVALGLAALSIYSRAPGAARTVPVPEGWLSGQCLPASWRAELAPSCTAQHSTNPWHVPRLWHHRHLAGQEGFHSLGPADGLSRSRCERWEVLLSELFSERPLPPLFPALSTQRSVLLLAHC